MDETTLDMILDSIREIKQNQKVEMEAISGLTLDFARHAEKGEQVVKDVEQNKLSISKIKDDVSRNTNDIEKMHEWRQAFDKVVWEIIKPPLKAIGIGFFLVVIIAGALVYLQ